jgi:hypothetical protein
MADGFAFVPNGRRHVCDFITFPVTAAHAAGARIDTVPRRGFRDLTRPGV